MTAVGANVSSFAVGDAAGVGVMVGSCGGCASCAAHEEQFCADGGPVFTYGSIDARHKGDGPTQVRAAAPSLRRSKQQTPWKPIIII